MVAKRLHLPPLLPSDKACGLSVRRGKTEGSTMNTVGVGLLGFGNVGSSVYEITRQRFGVSTSDSSALEVKKILVRDPTRARSIALPRHLATTDPAELLTDPGVQIVVELLGWSGHEPEPALDLLRRALKAGKHVVTANKRLLAEHGRELCRMAVDSRVSVWFEASVCGALPVIRTISESLVAPRVTSLHAILNGTTNFILTRMSRGKIGFDQALCEAQSRGLAEADASWDISGHDAACKLCILAALLTGVGARPSHVLTHGISDVQADDVHLAEALGYSVKLVSSLHMEGEVLHLRVRPTLVPHTHILARVEDAANAVVINTDLARQYVLMGEGAGGYPTACAVIADIIGAAHSLSSASMPRAQMLLAQSRDTTTSGWPKAREVERLHYLRSASHTLDALRSEAHVLLKQVSRGQRFAAIIGPITTSGLHDVLAAHSIKEAVSLPVLDDGRYV